MHLNDILEQYQAEMEALRTRWPGNDRKSAVAYIHALRGMSKRAFRELLGLHGRHLYGAQHGNKFTYTHCYVHYFAAVACLVSQPGGAEVLKDRGQLAVLHNIALHYNGHRIREFADWQAKSACPKNWVLELVHFLFDAFPTPDFLNCFWFIKAEPRVRTWYLFVARGGSLRNLPDPPLPVSRKIAHVPRTMPFERRELSQVFRKAQLQAMGAHPSLAEAILGSFLGRGEVDQKIWKPVLAFLIHHFDPDGPAQIGAILDYLAHEFQRQREPAEAPFTLQGRTLASLQRATEAWHLELQMQRYGELHTWEAQKIPGFEVLGEAAEAAHADRIVIQELTMGMELVCEGSTMHHCVASYQSQCVEGQTSIWSLRREVNGNLQALVTMEMDNNSRTLVQIRAAHNRKPEKAWMDYVRAWCGRHNIRISDYAEV